MPEGHGHEGFKRLAGAYLAAFLGMQITVEDALDVGDKVVRRIGWLGTHRGPFLGVPPIGRRVRGQGIVTTRTRDGKITEEWEMSDLLGLLRQLGAVPPFQPDLRPA
jgi:predicted ester cyclase